MLLLRTVFVASTAHVRPLPRLLTRVASDAQMQDPRQTPPCVMLEPIVGMSDNALEQDPAMPRDRRAILAPWLNRLRSPARLLRTVQTCRLWTERETIGGTVHALRLLISARRAARVVG